jgi:hypothetical protein
MHVGLADDDGAGRAQLCRHRRILRRHVGLQCRRAGRRGQAFDLDIVLDRDRHAAERLAEAVPVFTIEGGRRLRGAGFIQCDEGVELGLRLGPGQHCCDQSLAPVFPGTEVGCGFGRRQRVQVEGIYGARRCRGEQHGPCQHGRTGEQWQAILRHGRPPLYCLHHRKHRQG